MAGNPALRSAAQDARTFTFLERVAVPAAGRPENHQNHVTPAHQTGGSLDDPDEHHRRLAGRSEGCGPRVFGSRGMMMAAVPLKRPIRAATIPMGIARPFRDL
jgi:hypothetical protein